MTHAVGTMPLCALAGSAVGPDFRKPVPATPGHWQAAEASAAGMQPITPGAPENLREKLP